MSKEITLTSLFAWFFGVVAFAASLVNVFWGNDPFFGIFIMLLSLVFFPPIGALVKRVTGFRIASWMKIVLGVFIAWATLGVGELFDKLAMMRADLFPR